ncbi:hypothetical protein BE221DRAFT_192164 [Ostreococcus tauri]|uniref:Uncharacterized protein n=1 Tax=Ostreococcus tauri TaxID=70448 RepID=A0A1Y5ID88_OSTTA|nr:hypothetical protein BE221DRAFT_192164 [Ostreococcus tauri]
MSAAARPRVCVARCSTSSSRAANERARERRPTNRRARLDAGDAVKQKQAITEVVRKARGGPASGAGRGRDAPSANAKTKKGPSGMVRSYENAEVAPAMPLVEVLEPETNRRLLCMLRRRFTLANGEERCLVLPVDTPIDVLRGEGLDESEDLSDIGDDELVQILPDMNRALAMRGFLLQRSAFCMTVRGAVRMNDEDALEMDTGGDEPNEGVEVCTFTSGSSRYLVYAPLNPVLLITNEDPESKLHEVCFDDDDVDERTLQANLDAEYEMLSEPEDELFADLAD